MRSQEERKPTAGTVGFQGEQGRVPQFSAIVAQPDSRSKPVLACPARPGRSRVARHREGYQAARQQAQADFLAYREAGGTMTALEWMYHFRPELFNQWVSSHSRGGHHDARPAFGRTRRDGERLVRGW